MDKGELETLVKSEIEWRKWLVRKVESIEDEYKAMSGTIARLDKCIAKLNVKSGVWGLMGGAIPVIIGLTVYFLQR